MRLGVILPTFENAPQRALDLAASAEAAGLDGVFAFDHLWPIGEATRPALAPFPVLALVGARTTTLSVGPLVARVALVGVAKLVEQFSTLATLYPGRVIAALGTGDKLSRPEEESYGLAVLSADERVARLDEALSFLTPLVPCWCGAGSPAVVAVARRHGAEVNLWRASPERVREAADEGPVNWAGPLGPEPRRTLDALAEAGATWAVSTASADIEELREWRSAT